MNGNFKTIYTYEIYLQLTDDFFLLSLNDVEHDILKYPLSIPHHSVDSVIENNKGNKLIYTQPSTTTVATTSATSRSIENLADYSLLNQQKCDVFYKAENQFRNLLISATSNSNYNSNKDAYNTHNIHHDYQNLTFANTEMPPPKRPSEETTDSRSSRSYDIDRAAKKFIDHDDLK